MHSRPLPWRPALGLALDPAPLDFAISDLFYTPGIGFAGKHSYVLENLLHDRARQAVIGLDC